MPGIDFAELRRQLALAEVLELAGFVPARRRGAVVRGPCPLHGSRAPGSRSFSAHLGRQVWHCFRCGAGGNALDLWVALTRQSLYVAARDLCQRLQRPVPWRESPRGPKRPRSPPPS